MAQDIRNFTVVVAPGSTPAAPQISPLIVPTRQVDRIDIRVPPGPLGQVGFAIGAAGFHVIPSAQDQWLVANNERLSYPTEGYLTSGQWQLIAYNTGVFPHTLYVTLLMSLVTAEQAAAAPPDLTALSNPDTTLGDLGTGADLGDVGTDTVVLDAGGV